jgi:hypothetical protein
MLVDIVCASRVNTLIIKFLSGKMNLTAMLLCISGRYEGLLISRAFPFFLENLIDDIIIPKTAIKAENVVGAGIKEAFWAARFNGISFGEETI